MGEYGKWSYFDLQKKFLGTSAKTFPGEHLGLRSIEAYGLGKGIDICVVNGQAANHRTLDETWSAVTDAAQAMGTVSAVGFTGTCEMFAENQELAQRVKREWQDVHTFLGHDFGSLNAATVLQRHQEFDFIIRGEGERAVTELAIALAEKRDLASVPNLVYRDSNGKIRTNPMHHALDLDDIPPPTRGDLRPILDMGLAAAVFTTRGCPYKCTYCTTGSLGDLTLGDPAYRSRSVVKVADEIESLVREHGVSHVTIVDDLFVSSQNSSRKRAAAFAQEIMARNLEVSLKIDCRVDSIHRETFEALHAAGLTEVFIGIETASDSQLQNYHKLYDASAHSQAKYIDEQLSILRELGITVSPGIITYHPKVTRSELELTAILIDTLGYRASYPFWSTVMAYPGTPLYREYLQEGLLDPDWPVPEWSFSDPRAKRHYESVKAAAEEDRFNFELIRNVFRAGLERWDAVPDGAKG